jgi:hypothetical protein
MGLNLTLVIDLYGLDNIFADYERLQLDLDCDLFDNIKQIETTPLREDRMVWWYSDKGIVSRIEDSRGNPLSNTSTKAISDIMTLYDLSPKNTAIATYLKALPSDTKVFLCWH